MHTIRQEVPAALNKAELAVQYISNNLSSLILLDGYSLPSLNKRLLSCRDIL